MTTTIDKNRTTLDPDIIKLFVIRPSEIDLEANASTGCPDMYYVGLRYGATATGEPFSWYYLTVAFHNPNDASKMLKDIENYGSVKLPTNSTDSNWNSCDNGSCDFSSWTLTESFDNAYPLGY